MAALSATQVLSSFVCPCCVKADQKPRDSRSFLALLLLSEFRLPCILKWARAVGLHNFGLEVGAGAQVARRQIHHAGRLSRLWLWLGSRARIVLLEPRHLLSLTHFEHLIFGGSHVVKLLLGLGLASGFRRSTLRLKLLDLRIDVVDLCSNVIDNLALEFIRLLRV